MSSQAKLFLFATGEWPPYTSKEMEGGGFSTQIVTEVLKIQGHSASCRFYPWSRALFLAERNRVMGTFPWTQTSDRKVIFDWTAPLFEQKEVLLYNTKFMEKFTWENFEDLRSYNIGGTQGYSHVELLKGFGLSVDTTTSDVLNLKKLYINRIDIFPIDYLTAQYLLQKHFSEDKDEFAFAEKPLQVKWLSVMVPKTHSSNEEFIPMFNEGLQKIKDNGTYQKLCNTIYK
jgi:polar amino acid transport system substrate-binding protein